MTHHRAGLLGLGADPALADQLVSDWRQANLTPAQRGMLAYAEKLTVSPWAARREDIEVLLALGFSERDVLDINQIVAYFAYANRLADGLGVPLEEFWGEPDSSGQS